MSEEIKYDGYNPTINDNELKCPYCCATEADTWELDPEDGEEGERECEKCEKIYHYDVSINYTYSTYEIIK